jgi:hypothetical protein
MARHKLVIIGNGFDLAHNLKSKYSDFLKFYLIRAIKTVEENTQNSYHGELVVRDGNPLQAKIDVDELNLVGLYDRMLLEGFRPTLFLSSLIARLKTSDSLNWVDIEYEYFKELSGIHRKILDYEGEPNKYSTQYSRLINLNKSFNYVKAMLIDYFKNERLNNEVVENAKIKEHIANLMHDIAFGKKPYNNHSLLPKVLFLNFNYTTTLNSYLNTYDKDKFNYDVVNIHGSIDDVNSIIFGYGDMMDPRFKEIENYNDNNFFINIKQFHYLQSNAYHNLISFMNQCSVNIKYDIHIMGHSCGTSDRVLFNKILNREKCERIFLYYHLRKKGDANNKDDDDFFEKIINISRHFDEKSKEYFIEMMATKAECKALT